MPLSYHLTIVVWFSISLTLPNPIFSFSNWIYFQSSSSKVLLLQTWFWKTCVSSFSSHLPSIHCNKVVWWAHFPFGSQILTSEATSLHALSQKERIWLKYLIFDTLCLLSIDGWYYFPDKDHVVHDGCQQSCLPSFCFLMLLFSAPMIMKL